MLWELDLTSGVPAGAINTVGTFNGTNGNFPAGGTFLAADGNLYGVGAGILSDPTQPQTVCQSVNTAGVFGVGPGTIPRGGGSGGGGGTSVLTPTVTHAVIPSSVITGAKVKGSVALKIADALTTPVEGFTINVYASIDNTLNVNSDTLSAARSKPFTA